MAQTSLQRLLILTITINLIIGLAGVMYNSTIDEGNARIDQDLESMSSYSYNYSQTFGNTTPDTQTVYLQKDFGDLKGGGQHWWSILGTAVVLIPNHEIEGSTEYYMIRNINYFRGFLVLLIGFEAFLIFYGKKVT